MRRFKSRTIEVFADYNKIKTNFDGKQYLEWNFGDNFIYHREYTTGVSTLITISNWIFY